MILQCHHRDGCIWDGEYQCGVNALVTGIPESLLVSQSYYIGTEALPDRTKHAPISLNLEYLVDYYGKMLSECKKPSDVMEV